MKSPIAGQMSGAPGRLLNVSEACKLKGRKEREEQGPKPEESGNRDTRQ